jgi:CO/xanthine dehydrogenase FAD-binding subunit
MPEERVRWYHPDTPEELAALIARHGSQCLLVAGGTDILPARREGAFGGHGIHIDLSRIGELRQIRAEPGELRIGSAVTHGCIRSDPLVLRHAPLLAAASGLVGSPQIRNRGTLGGNVITLSPCADTPPALLAHDASLIFYRKGGFRVVAIGVYLEDAGERYLPGEEFLYGFSIPLRRDGTWAYHFEKLARKRGAAKSGVSMAVGLSISGGLIADARLALGAVTPWARRYAGAEDLLRGKKPDSRLFREAGERIAAEIPAISGHRPSFEYKLPAVTELAVRSLVRAAEESRG